MCSGTFDVIDGKCNWYLCHITSRDMEGLKNATANEI